MYTRTFSTQLKTAEKKNEKRTKRGEKENIHTKRRQKQNTKNKNTPGPKNKTKQKDGNDKSGRGKTENIIVILCVNRTNIYVN